VAAIHATGTASAPNRLVALDAQAKYCEHISPVLKAMPPSQHLLLISPRRSPYRLLRVKEKVNLPGDTRIQQF
jgi:hypothetical protein